MEHVCNFKMYVYASQNLTRTIPSCKKTLDISGQGSLWLVESLKCIFPHVISAIFVASVSY